MTLPYSCQTTCVFFFFFIKRDSFIKKLHLVRVAFKVVFNNNRNLPTITMNKKPLLNFFSLFNNNIANMVNTYSSNNNVHVFTMVPNSNFVNEKQIH